MLNVMQTTTKHGHLELSESGDLQKVAS